MSRSALVVVVAVGEFGAEVEEAPLAREIEIRDPVLVGRLLAIIPERVVR